MVLLGDRSRGNLVRAPPGRTFSEQCTRLFDGSTQDHDSSSCSSSASPPQTAFSTPLIWSENDPVISMTTTTVQSGLRHTTCSTHWWCWWYATTAFILAGLVMFAYLAGSHLMTRDLQLELELKMQAQQALEASQMALKQETMQLQQDHQTKHASLQSTLSSLSRQLQHKEQSLQQFEIERMTQWRIHEGRQQMKTITTTMDNNGLVGGSSSSSSGFTTTTSSRIGGDTTATTTSRDEIVTKLVQNLALEHYGLEPLQVEMHLRLHHQRDENHSKEQVVTNSFVTAELSMQHMPVTVFTFLKQVEHGLYNHVHLQQAYEDDNDNETTVALAAVASLQDLQWRERQALGLARVPVLETTPQQVGRSLYQLGMDEYGRLFFVSTSNNQQKQQQQQIHSFCFAKIVRGDNVVKELLEASNTASRSSVGAEIVSIHRLSPHEHHHESPPPSHVENENHPGGNGRLHHEKEENEEIHDAFLHHDFSHKEGPDDAQTLYR